jgi:hypothetical protein
VDLFSQVDSSITVPKSATQNLSSDNGLYLVNCIPLIASAVVCKIPGHLKMMVCLLIDVLLIV